MRFLHNKLTHTHTHTERERDRERERQRERDIRRHQANHCTKFQTKHILINTEQSLHSETYVTSQMIRHLSSLWTKNGLNERGGNCRTSSLNINIKQ